MKFLMFVCDDGPFDADPSDLDPTAWVAEMDSRGVRLAGDRLQPPSDAATVRVRDGALLVSDGPYTETKESIAGFDILECDDLNEAIQVAAKHPMAKYGMIDIRPFWQW